MGTFFKRGPLYGQKLNPPPSPHPPAILAMPVEEGGWQGRWVGWATDTFAEHLASEYRRVFKGHLTDFLTYIMQSHWHRLDETRFDRKPREEITAMDDTPVISGRFIRRFEANNKFQPFEWITNDMKMPKVLHQIIIVSPGNMKLNVYRTTDTVSWKPFRSVPLE